ncbi:hypothetical protein [Streptomyces aureus]|uniref:hypothetical protein n=1 Tax=Streptomyces aureus TaxID=193461 RepID=UPI00131D3FBA|nr:hypothetical protein [Streptomyces aureus]
MEIWNLYADHVDDPFLRGHLHHLLLDAGHGRRPDHVRGAATGYLDTAQLLLTAEDGHRWPRAAQCLKRAGELSLKFKQPELRERVTKDALTIAEHLLADANADAEGRPLLAALETLQTLKCDVADLAEQAVSLFTHDMDVRLGLLDALRKNVPPSRHAEIDTAVVHTLLDAADTADAGHRRLPF